MIIRRLYVRAQFTCVLWKQRMRVYICIISLWQCVCVEERESWREKEVVFSVVSAFDQRPCVCVCILMCVCVSVCMWESQPLVSWRQDETLCLYLGFTEHPLSCSPSPHSLTPSNHYSLPQPFWRLFVQSHAFISHCSVLTSSWPLFF